MFNSIKKLLNPGSASITFTVTLANLKNGTYWQRSNCPIALALQALYPEKHIRVNYASVEIGTNLYRMTEEDAIMIRKLSYGKIEAKAHTLTITQ